MIMRKRLLVCLVMLLLACRLPYALGRSLASPTETNPAPTIVSAAATFTPVINEAEPQPGSTSAQPPYPETGELQSTAQIPSLDTPYPGDGPADPLSATPAATEAFDASGEPQETTPALVIQPPTLIPSATPFLTFTPTISPTPTLTRTPLPLPPWSRAPLEATDPRTVKLASGEVQLVEFFAYWSGPSQAMAPILQGVEDEYRDQVNFVYLDIDNPVVDAFADELGFDRAPQFFLLAPDGRIVEEWTGYVAVADLRAAIESALNP